MLISTGQYFLLCSQQGSQHVGHMCRSSTYEMLTDPEVAVHVFDTVDQKCEYTHPPSDMSCLNTSAVGSGLDSDFGASAGTARSPFCRIVINMTNN